MKTLKVAIFHVLQFFAIALGMILISITDVNEGYWPHVMLMVGAFIVSVLLAVWIHNPNNIYRHLIAMTTCVIAFIGQHKPKISAGELILARRKNSLGGYSNLYRDSLERYDDIAR